ncbi:acyl-CoA dehydrogenase [Pseudomonas sp. BAY1663]|nr:acyl-CoA dehydrogenase [Pseudomonas sp. BAY1663]
MRAEQARNRDDPEQDRRTEFHPRRRACLCAEFPAEYWRKIDEEKGFPEAFVSALTQAGWLSAMIPEEYGGSGLGLAEASVILEEVNRCGGNSGTVHGQMYNMFTLLRNGSEEQKRYYLPSWPAASCACSPWGSPSRPPAPTPPRSRPPR